MNRTDLLYQQARAAGGRILLLVLDGVGDLRTEAQPSTPLEAATTPHLDELARSAALGRLVPATTGITPGSGPGHLALFGYPPTAPEHDIGRGVLEALGLGLELGQEEIIARGNFATVDAQGRLTDRRAGRIPTSEGRRLCRRLNEELETRADLEVEIHPGEGYRFVVVAKGEGLSPALADTDPQRLGVAPLPLRAESAAADATVARLEPVLAQLGQILGSEPRANAFLLRGFSRLPSLPSFSELYALSAGAFAGYPLYRGVARACGMEVVECGKSAAELCSRVAQLCHRFDYFFAHVKQTDMAGEDGDFDKKVAALEEVDAALPTLLDTGIEVVAITGDHSTPVPMKAHSWHPVPLLVRSAHCFVDETTRFTEPEANRGTLGTFPASELMGLLLAHAGRLAKFGA